MAKTLTFAGNNLLPQYVTNSAKITEYIQNKSNKMDMQIVVKSGDIVPQEGAEVIFKDDTRFLFAGFVSKVNPVEIGEGQMFNYDVEVSDYGFIFGNKIVRRAYSNKTLKFIVEDLLTDFLGMSYSYTTTNVQTGPTISSITFDHIDIRKCFEKLAKRTGYVWWVDYEKKVFFQTKQTDIAPEQITDTTANMDSINIAYDTSQVRNSVIVLGSEDGEQSANTRTETFTGDSETRSWEIEEKPSQIVSIKLNGVIQQFSLELNARDTDDFLYSFNEKRIFLAAGTATPGAVDIVVEYYPRVPIITQKTDIASVAFFAALDGGDGIYEYTIKEPSITSKAEAIERAEQELAEFTDPLVIGQFKTRSGLLATGPASIFKPGQILTVNLPTHAINTDTAFLIQQVNIQLVEDGTTTEYIYTVRFGGKLVGVSEFLEGLASTGIEVTDVEEIKTIQTATDSLEMADSTPTETLFTPPFQYGAGGSPQGIWNKSEWA